MPGESSRGLLAGDSLAQLSQLSDSVSTALAMPWHATDWNSQALLKFFDAEIRQAQALFKDPLQPMEPSPFAALPASLTFRDLSFARTAPDGTKQTILEPVSGHIPAGQLVAIMGPSGCGKSTLLDMLANKKTAAYAGSVCVNGRPRDHLFRRLCAYVGQEEAMPEHWTVREAVEFNHALKAHKPHEVPRAVQRHLVDTTLQAFGLSGVAETLVGGPSVRGISGGQRRRVALARGVIASASLLLCDEPTSGLSATDAELCIKALRIMAKKYGVTVVVVIHQPRVEVAALFDDLILLTASPGRMVYSGPMAKALPYWAECGYPVPPQANPTDWFLDTVTPGAPQDHSDEFVRLFQQKQLARVSADAARHVQTPGMSAVDMLRAKHERQEEAQMRPRPAREKVFAVPWHVQFRLLVRRKLKAVRRTPASALLPILVPVFQGLLMGCMFQGIGDKPMVLQLPFVFILLTVLCMSGMQLMPALIGNRHVMKYETSEALYSELSFMLANAVVDIPLNVTGATMCCVIMYTFSGLPWDYFGTIIGWAILLFFVFDSLFGFIAATAADAQKAQVMAIPFNSIFMLFSGFMVTKASAPVFLRWIFQISPNAYAMQAIVIKMAETNPEGPAIVEQYGFKEGEEAKGLCVMVALIVVLRTLQFLSLKFRNSIQR